MKRNLREMLPVLILALMLFVLLVIASRGQSVVAVGGSFILEKQVIAGGAVEKPGVLFVENGTTGQAVAGSRSSGAALSVYSGFWTPDDLMPTAAGVSITGRVLTADGMGIRNVVITLTSSTGATLTTRTSGFGNFSFVDLTPGHTCVLQAISRRYEIEQPSRILNLQSDVADLIFIAQTR